MGGGFLGWLVNTFFALIFGLVWGAVVAFIVEGVTRLTRRATGKPVAAH